MSDRAVEIDGQPWQDGWVGVDQGGALWRLRFDQHWWGPAHDRWVWLGFGRDGGVDLDSAEVKRPLTKVWPADPPPRVAKKAAASS